MLLVAVIAWMLVVGVCLGRALLVGLRTFRRARAAQATLQSRMAVLEAGGLSTLEERTGELNVKVAQMQAALEGLEHSLAGLELLTAPVKDLASLLLKLRRIVRR